MESNQHIERALAWSNARMLNDRCSGLFFNDMGRAALLAVIFGVVVMLATGCSSTGGGVKAGLMEPQEPQEPQPNADIVAANRDWYQQRD
jgi:hypothetical protein